MAEMIDVSGGTGVTSVSKLLGTPLTGDVTLSEGAGVTLLQVGQNIAIASLGVPGIQGPAGPMGPPGMDGQDGEDGQPGSPGAAGAAGSPGSIGPVGPAVFLVGEEGEEGLMGPPGIAGPQGATGGTGGVGATGPSGPAIFLMGEDADPGEGGLVELPSISQPNDPGPNFGLYAPGSFDVPSGRYALMAKLLQLTGTQRVRLEGTGRLSIHN